MSAPFLAVVVPAYNEEDRIASSLESLTNYLSQQSYTWEIVVADDGSSDDTVSIVTEVAKRLPSTRLISLPHRGKGAAVRGWHGSTGSVEGACYLLWRETNVGRGGEGRARECDSSFKVCS